LPNAVCQLPNLWSKKASHPEHAKKPCIDEIETPESISPNFVFEAKSCQRTGFGEKFSDWFHQHSNCADEICQFNALFAKTVYCLPNAICQKASHTAATKNPLERVLMKLIHGLSKSF